MAAPLNPLYLRPVKRETWRLKLRDTGLVGQRVERGLRCFVRLPYGAGRPEFTTFPRGIDADWQRLRLCADLSFSNLSAAFSGDAPLPCAAPGSLLDAMVVAVPGGHRLRLIVLDLLRYRDDWLLGRPLHERLELLEQLAGELRAVSQWSVSWGRPALLRGADKAHTDVKLGSGETRLLLLRSLAGLYDDRDPASHWWVRR